jgi:hypothetical protein
VFLPFIILCIVNDNFFKSFVNQLTPSLYFQQKHRGFKSPSPIIELKKEKKKKVTLLAVDAVFVEKILRLQPKVKRLYLLLRDIENHSATHRFHNEVLNSVCLFLFFFFSFLDTPNYWL